MPMRNLFFRASLTMFACTLMIMALGCGGGSGGDSADLNLSAQSCGNGLMNEGEACDDGNANNSDGCNLNCALEVGEASCGNGIKENTECCDDGNNLNGDGCNSLCSSEKNNRPPTAPLLALQPENGATWAPTRLYLQWDAAHDGDAGDEIVYDVYFGSDSSNMQTPYKVGVAETHFIIQASTDNRAEYFPDYVRPIYLEKNETYLWKVCARDKIGASNCSETRVFNTDDSVVGWWRFDEDPNAGVICEGGSAGETVCDYSGNGNHGQANGIPVWISPNVSPFIGGVQFDGINDQINIFNVPNLTQELTVQAMLTPRVINGETQRIVNKLTEAPPHNGFNLDFTSLFRFEICNSSVGCNAIFSETEVVAGTPYFLSGGYDGNEMTFYVNGNLESSELNSTPIGINSSPLKLGHGVNNQYYSGIFQEIILHRRNVFPMEIINFYQSINFLNQ